MGFFVLEPKLMEFIYLSMMETDLTQRAIELAQRPYLSVTMMTYPRSDYPYIAINPNLNGCMAQGKTMQEAKDNLDAFRIDYMEHLLEHGLPIPDLVLMQDVITIDLLP